MTDGFARTLQTAASAQANAALLERVAKEVRSRSDADRLNALAERYRDYAAALRETAADLEPENDPDDQPMLAMGVP